MQDLGPLLRLHVPHCLNRICQCCEALFRARRNFQHARRHSIWSEAESLMRKNSLSLRPLLVRLPVPHLEVFGL